MKIKHFIQKPQAFEKCFFKPFLLKDFAAISVDLDMKNLTE
jgi:hypothetical protein